MIEDRLYTVMELSKEVTAYQFPALPAEPTFIAKLPTQKEFPPPPASDNMLAAEILVPAPNASFPAPLLYASNRNDPSPAGDVIAIYSLADPAAPQLVAEVRSGLQHLRGMVFGGPHSEYLVAGGANGHKVKMFERTDGGRGLRELASLDLQAPTGFLWA